MQYLPEFGIRHSAKKHRPGARGFKKVKSGCLTCKYDQPHSHELMTLFAEIGAMLHSPYSLGC